MENILRIAAAVPHLYLGNVEKNVDAHLEKLREAAEKKASLVVFPELSLTGYTCGDLFFQDICVPACCKRSDLQVGIISYYIQCLCTNGTGTSQYRYLLHFPLYRLHVCLKAFSQPKAYARRYMTGAVMITESKRSSMPPCPGISFP